MPANRMSLRRMRATALLVFGPIYPLDPPGRTSRSMRLAWDNPTALPDGMRATFPRYNYDYMVLSQERLVTEGLGVKHWRLVIGNSMGGMQAWIRSVRYPEICALMPMCLWPACPSRGPAATGCAGCCG